MVQDCSTASVCSPNGVPKRSSAKNMLLTMSGAPGGVVAGTGTKLTPAGARTPLHAANAGPAHASQLPAPLASPDAAPNPDSQVTAVPRGHARPSRLKATSECVIDITAMAAMSIAIRAVFDTGLRRTTGG